MADGSSPHEWGKRLEGWSPGLFLVAGSSLVVYAALHGTQAFTSAAYPAVRDVFGPAGFVVGFIGLLGLYPVLAERTPRLARVGAGAATLGAVGFSVITVSSLGRVAGVVSSEPSAWFPVLLVMVTVGMVVGYLAFGAATLRTDVHSRRVGGLLLAPGLIFAVMLSGGAVGFTPQWSAFLISAGQAVVCLSIGYTLGMERPPAEREVPSGDVTTG